MGKKSVILLSGGLDSAANLAFARKHSQPVLALTFDYGQQAAGPEVRAAGELSRYYQVPHRVISIPWLGQLSRSGLISGQVPEPPTSELDAPATAARTAAQVWVPNRNGVFIHIAAAHAEALGADEVVVGFNAEEAMTFPDNSVSYLQAESEALSFSTATKVKVFSFTAEFNKREIVARLRLLRPAFPFAVIWSCYLGEDHPCGKCESCQRLGRALGPSVQKEANRELSL